MPHFLVWSSFHPDLSLSPPEKSLIIARWLSTLPFSQMDYSGFRKETDAVNSTTGVLTRETLHEGFWFDVSHVCRKSRVLDLKPYALDSTIHWCRLLFSLLIFSPLVRIVQWTKYQKPTSGFKCYRTKTSKYLFLFVQLRNSPIEKSKCDLLRS